MKRLGNRTAEAAAVAAALCRTERWWIHARPCDDRASPSAATSSAEGCTPLSFDRLAGLVRNQLRADPLSRHGFVFFNRTRTRTKIFAFDRHGYADYHRRPWGHGVYAP